jgi:hypothetical protein
VTGSQILAAFSSIGAVVRLTPAGVVDVDAPAVPELERLVAEVKANRAEVVEELKRHAVHGLPGRAERPCLACGRQCPEGVLFDTASCYETWKARRRLSTLPRVTTNATGRTRSIPSETSPSGGDA